jgi:HdeA/HdeB family
MTTSYQRVFAGAAVFAAACLPAAVSAQDKGDRTTDQYTCKDIMRESGPNRDVAIAFVHGYLLGKSGSAKFNIEMLEKQTDSFVDRCLENPGEKAIDAMIKVKG